MEKNLRKKKMFNLLRFVFERIDGLAIDKYSIEILVNK